MNFNVPNIMVHRRVFDLNMRNYDTKYSYFLPHGTSAHRKWGSPFDIYWDQSESGTTMFRVRSFGKIISSTLKTSLHKFLYNTK